MCKKMTCCLLECFINQDGLCSYSNLPYENPCWKCIPIYEDEKIVEWIIDESFENEEV